MEYEYIVRNWSDKYPQDAKLFESKATTDVGIASDAARYLFNTKNGRKSAWPITIEIYKEGTCINISEVHIMFGVQVLGDLQ